MSQPEKVALVTGSGAPRVGNVVARHLAALGYRLALHANTSTEDADQTAADLRQGGAEVIVVQGAIDDADRVEGIVDEVVEEWGRIDVLVNSAAIWSPKRLEEVGAEDLRHYFDVNAVGTFVASRAAGLRRCRRTFQISFKSTIRKP